MSSPGQTNESSSESSPAPYQVQKPDILSNKSAQYFVLGFNGEGSFGKVARCINLETSETTAIKIHMTHCDDEDIQYEVKMLEMLRALDPERNNLVRFMDNFTFQGASCLVFEMLDKSLWDLVDQRQGPLSISEIRPVAHQLLVAFKALKEIGIIHTDLKPDNVMLVNHQDEPFRVKLIDFGVAIPVSEVEPGWMMQPCAYRAPEVNLGLPVSEAIDMWGLGCVLAFLYSALNLFPDGSEYDMMKVICQLLGQPGDHLLNAATHTCEFFRREDSSISSGWKLMTTEECEERTGVKPQISQRYGWENMDQVVQSALKQVDNIVEYYDTRSFFHLLKCLLDLDAETRITPEQALNHPFLTMEDLKMDPGTSSYAEAAFELMTVIPLDDRDTFSDSENDVKSTGSSYSVLHTNNSSYDNIDDAPSDYDAPLQRESFSSEDSDNDNSNYKDYNPQANNYICSPPNPPNPPCGSRQQWEPSSKSSESSPAPHQVQKHDILSNKSAHCFVLDFNSEGSFGKVARCINLETSKTTAIKIHMTHCDDEDIQYKVKMLEMLRALDPEKNNLVRFMDNFTFQGASCLTFEMLDKSLWDLVDQRQGPLSINEIHPVAHQLLVAFKALKEIGIIHTDLKPDNVMLVNHQDEPFRVKLIDFNVVIPISEVEPDWIMQPCAYRAPEVNLGLPISEKSFSRYIYTLSFYALYEFCLFSGVRLN